MKRNMFLPFLLLGLIIVLTGCLRNKTSSPVPIPDTAPSSNATVTKQYNCNRFSSDSINSIEIFRLGDVKKINEDKDKEKMIDFLNSIDFKENHFRGEVEGNLFSIKITMKSKEKHSIAFYGDKLNYLIKDVDDTITSNKWFSSNEDILNRIKDIYNTIK